MGNVIVAVVVAVSGLIIYALFDKPKVAEVGRILFFCGAFALVLMYAGKVVHLP
jgi:hypothetical protein